jgi:hypothetical protein
MWQYRIIHNGKEYFSGGFCNLVMLVMVAAAFIGGIGVGIQLILFP